MAVTQNEIPRSLSEQIKEGNVVLFLGAGAAIGALHPQSSEIPQGQQLANLLAKKFLGERHIGKPLSFVAELAISETNLHKVQSYLAELFHDLQPAPFHKLIPTFVWKAIATTNYDLLIETAYQQVKDRTQDIAVCKRNGESIETKLTSRRNVLFLKLHGCITEIADENLPLILTPDQYITHRKGRSRLFERIQQFAYDCPFLFVGTSLADPDIRAILLEISQSQDARPRSFMVGPNISDEEVRLWETKKITAIRCTFGEFMAGLDSAIETPYRKLTALLPEHPHPIAARFKTASDLNPSASLLGLLTSQVDYLHKGFGTSDTDPKNFYRGYFTTWDPIARQLDVTRALSDSLLSEIFLEDESSRETQQQLFLIKGHAGSGKSVLLKRLAWDAAVEFDKLCLFLKPGAAPSFEPLSELYNFCKERIFFFVDSATDNVELIAELLSRSRKEKLPLTVITTERMNEWNEGCQNLCRYLTQDYHLKYLSDREIEGLISKLDKHKCLGHLEGLLHEKQVESLSKIAGRELLVALHEATFGKPFPEIILDEYKSIPSTKAQSLYLTVSILHRLRVPVRAGLISRVHGITFASFKENLFSPLESVVFTTKDTRINDYLYQTRHPHIAELVFEQILASPQDRFDEYVRIIKCLDLDYNSDLQAFKGLVNAKSLMTLFPDSQMVRQIYSHAESRSPEDPILMQQFAIYEMNSPSGNLDKAAELLRHAQEKAPWYKPVAHSLAELALKKSNVTKNDLERKKYLNEAQDIATQILSQKPETSHARHTLIKVKLSKLQDALSDSDELTVERLLKDIEASISSAKQAFPQDSFILEAESNFSAAINDEPRAFQAIKKAFEANKRSPYIAIRLATLYLYKGNRPQAEHTLKEALDQNPGDKDLNYRLAILLLDQPKPNLTEARFYLRRSFTSGDSRFEAQFACARVLFLLGEHQEADRLFKSLREARLDIELKRKPIGHVLNSSRQPEVYRGTLTKVEHSFAFLALDASAASVFVYRYHDHPTRWDDLRIGDRVAFGLSFTYRGPIAVKLIRLD